MLNQGDIVGLDFGAIVDGYYGDAARTVAVGQVSPCLLYTSDAADERSSVDLGGRRIIKKKKTATMRTQE